MFLALHRVCRKARKSVFAMFIWRLSSIFDLGLCVFDRPIRIQHFTPCARVVDRQALGTRLGYSVTGQIVTGDPHFNNVLTPLQLAVRSCDVRFYDCRLKIRL